MAKKQSANKILHLSTFPPRECGIATFTQDLIFAFDRKFNPKIKSQVLALNDHSTSIYNYDKKVMDEIPSADLESYVSLAKKLNRMDDVKIINIQHEFGLFGGDWGNYIIPFLQVIEKPVVVTLHSVLSIKDGRLGKRNSYLKKIINSIAEKSSALVVMNKFSQEILESEYNIPSSKIFLIPHGIPQTPLEPSEKFKALFGLEGKIILSTFGLLSPNKGVEYAIRALPNVVKKYPNVVYMVLGVTHPQIRAWDGETYRTFLTQETEKLGLKNNVKFYNKYLTLEEVVNYLKATDVYVSPSIDSEQSVSGTLAYALGCGRPVVATDSMYAKYLVNQNSGVLVSPKNPAEIEKAILGMLQNPKQLKSMSIGAYELSRKMIWPNVAVEYFKLYQKFTDIREEETKFPPIKMDHIVRLTDNFGMLQFAKYIKPQRRYGYTLDDNARALIACVKCYEKSFDPEILDLAKKYMKAIKFMQTTRGEFVSAVSYQKKRDSNKYEDVQGRAVWALGYVASCDFLPEGLAIEAAYMFKKALKFIMKLDSPRAIAFSMTGIYHYIKKYPAKYILNLFGKLAESQFNLYKNRANDEWQWFEDYLTYSNSKLSESLLYAYLGTRKKKYLTAAEDSLEFLSKNTFKDGIYWPIGQNGWYFRNKTRAYFDQQPEDTASMVETKALAYQITKNKKHRRDALNAFKWFLGKNHLNQMVYDEVTGGCNDGIHQNRINLNQGAESTVSYLLARLAIEEVTE